jgi:predicted nucleic acid-binding protein
VPDIVVDTCCLVNLCAVDDLPRFLPAFGLTWQIPTAVAGEGLFIREADADGRAKKRQIDLAPCFVSKVVSLCDIEGAEEASLYVALAGTLDDGEAMALAIAKNRGWTVATDDGEARRAAERLSVPVLTTPELMRRWADSYRVAASEVAAALLRIETLARFVPSDGFPEQSWWVKAIARRRPS